MAETDTTTLVETKPAFLSKINWTQTVAFVSSMSVLLLGREIPPEQQLAIVAIINAVANIATVVMKTWFTTTLTPSSAAKL